MSAEKECLLNRCLQQRTHQEVNPSNLGTVVIKGERVNGGAGYAVELF